MSDEIDIFLSSLVPKQEILPEDEKKILLEKLHITESQLPKVMSSDPAVKILGAKKGEVLKISRKSQTAGDCVYYRIVIG